MDLEKFLKDKWQQGQMGPVIDEPTLPGLQKMANHAAGDDSVEASSDTAKGYDDGGTPDPDVSPASDFDSPMSQPSWQDKLQSVLSAMGAAGKQAIAPLGLGSPSSDAVMSGAANAAQTPGIAQSINAVIPSANLQDSAPRTPLPAPQPAPVTPTPPPSQSASTQTVPAQPSAQPVNNSKPSPTDLISKLTGNDSDTLQALTKQLQDHDTRAKFAQALAIIADTFGNIGEAGAGRTPQGFTSLAAIKGVNDQRRQQLIDSIPQKLAADPNSQTSRFAQMQVIKAMGLQPNDPRYATIMKTPAGVLIQQMPQLNDSIKTRLEAEKNQIMSQQANSESKLRAEEIQAEENKSKREQQVANQNAANATIKDLSPANPSNWGLLQKAKQTLGNSLGGGQGSAAPITATNAMGHKIQSTDGGHTWTPIQ